MTVRRSRPGKENTAPRLRACKMYVGMGIVLAVVIAGALFSSWQHFSSWDYSMRNSRLRDQINKLESEQRRLIVAREVALSPAAVKRTFFKIESRNSVIPAVERKADNSTPAVASTTKIERTVDSKPTNAPPVSVAVKANVTKTRTETLNHIAARMAAE